MTHRSEDLANDGAARAARVAEVEADVRSRLRPVCATLPADEFAMLVRRIADVTVKYEVLAEARSVRVRTPPDPTAI